MGRERAGRALAVRPRVPVEEVLGCPASASLHTLCLLLAEIKDVGRLRCLMWLPACRPPADMTAQPGWSALPGEPLAFAAAPSCGSARYCSVGIRRTCRGPQTWEANTMFAPVCQVIVSHGPILHLCTTLCKLVRVPGVLNACVVRSLGRYQPHPRRESPTLRTSVV